MGLSKVLTLTFFAIAMDSSFASAPNGEWPATTVDPIPDSVVKVITGAMRIIKYMDGLPDGIEHQAAHEYGQFQDILNVFYNSSIQPLVSLESILENSVGESLANSYHKPTSTKVKKIKEHWRSIYEKMCPFWILLLSIREKPKVTQIEKIANYVKENFEGPQIVTTHAAAVELANHLIKTKFDENVKKRVAQGAARLALSTMKAETIATMRLILNLSKYSSQISNIDPGFERCDLNRPDLKV